MHMTHTFLVSLLPLHRPSCAPITGLEVGYSNFPVGGREYIARRHMSAKTSQVLHTISLFPAQHAIYFTAMLYNTTTLIYLSIDL